MTKPFRVSRYLHFCFKEVPEFLKDTPEKSINIIVLAQDATGVWDTHYKQPYGKLLRVTFVTEVLTDFDPVSTEVEILREAMLQKQAEVQMELKAMQDRINDLLMIGYDGGQATVVDVQEVAEVTDVTDAMAKAHDNDAGGDDDIPF